MLKPGASFVDGKIKEPEWEWHYSPRDISFSNTVDEFMNIFDSIVKNYFKDQKVILPISGGLDSRTLAISLDRNDMSVESFSYYFDGGHNESNYAESITKVLGYPHRSFLVKSGYLWNDLGRISKINGSYTEFTHPRQAAFLDNFKNLGEVFCLGHWGDVLFHNLGLDNNITFDEEVRFFKKIIIKKGDII